MTISPAETLATLARTLQPASQATLLQFAEFLQAREAEVALDPVDEEVEAEWDRLFSDPVKMANFTHWADEQFAREKSEPLDPARL